MESAFPHLLRTTSKKSIDSAYASSSLTTSPTRPFLKRVNLCCNPLADTGLYYLLDALQSDVGVAAIDLQFTKLTNAGLEAAWLVLQDVPGAVALDVRNNADADHEWIAKVLALAGTDNLKDPELAWIPDGVHPLEASLAQGANAPPRVPKVKSAVATTRYAVPHVAKSPVKSAHAAAAGAGVQVPRPAWRPAGISQLPTVAAGGADTKKASSASKKGHTGMSPQGQGECLGARCVEACIGGLAGG
ncbi:hypothetical protein BCR44DRAFT_62900 [Catenaria anguillulae PL171]|uniref:RNI-like protein n=1 Tax=Catenaria anguillulae PL171 TaxID=765915 RepID=A0A1Y2HXF0_9FUNG|nr:hypothetical protein BCR44DRAFT_62900 [Catenaria anguillulae PL171]